MKTIRYLFILSALSVLLCLGCKTSGGDKETASMPIQSGSAQKTNGSVPQEAPRGTPSGTVAHEPPADIPKGGVVITPENPDDPKFKADPRLAGG